MNLSFTVARRGNLQGYFRFICGRPITCEGFATLSIRKLRRETTHNTCLLFECVYVK